MKNTDILEKLILTVIHSKEADEDKINNLEFLFDLLKTERWKEESVSEATK